jgi:branched-chain amino acid transport system permease protein
MKASTKASTVWLVLALAVFAILPLFVGDSWTSLIIEMFIMAIAASGANMMAGYAGMVSFGVAGFYGTGAYVTALLLTKANAPFGIAFLAGPVVAAILALPIGWFCVRRTAIYFAMLSLAFAQVLYVIAFTWYSFTGGDDGIVGVPVPSYLTSIFSYYYFAFVILIICLVLMRIVVKSPFGKTIQAMRDNPERTRFVGIKIRTYQHALYVMSSFFLGVAGSLFCGFNKNVFADYLHWVKTFDITIVYLLGGIYTFMGPTVGAMIYIFLNKFIVSYTEYWLIVLGGIIVLLVIFMPKGVAGSFLDRISAMKSRKEKLI